MRINVYSQELMTDQGLETLQGLDASVELIIQKSNTGVAYSAVRMFLHSSDRLHHPPFDDDRSAITFWLPKSNARREALAATFLHLAELVMSAPPETGLD